MGIDEKRIEEAADKYEITYLNEEPEFYPRRTAYNAFKAGAQFGQALERERAAGLVEGIKMVIERGDTRGHKSYLGIPFGIYSVCKDILAKYESGGSGE